MSHKPTVLIYRSRLLPISETFVRQHYDSMDRYRPVFAGLRHVDGVPIDDTERVMLEQGGRPNKVKLAAFKAFGLGPAFRRAIAAQNPDVIHAHFAVDATDMLPIARALRIPLVVTLHGYDVTFTNDAFRAMGAEGRIFLAKRRNLFAKADRFLPVSNFIAEQARAAGAPDDKSSVHYLGIDLAKFPKVTTPRDNAVLYVGRLVEKKGLNLLIEAMEKAGANETGTVLRVIGDGPKREEFLAMAQDRLKHFEYLGAQPHDRVIAELARARVFSVPSVPSSSGDNEGLPISYMEAAAMGVPVVSFAQGGILEAVKDGETGLLAPTRDVDTLAAHLKRLLNNPDLCNQMGQAGRAYVEQVFDAQSCAARLQDIYDDVIG